MSAATAGRHGLDLSAFDELVTWASGRLQGEEVLLADVAGESSDFVRFNGGDVRQAGSVQQAVLSVDLVAGRRHTAGSLQLSGDADLDRGRLDRLLGELRDQRSLVAEDPFLLFNTEPTSSESIGTDVLPAPEHALADVRSAAGDSDLVGIYTAGTIVNGFANSLGQRNWHQSATFSLDWSFYLRADKAAKNLYAGFEWDDDTFAAKVDWSRRQLAVLERDPIDLAPGGYRTYLAPAAMDELVDLWSWGGFGHKDHETRQTPLLRMITEGATLAPEVHVREDTAGGVAPDFGEAGFRRPAEVVLIEAGAYRDTLVSPRSAQEYDVPTNGASSWECPESLAIAPGTLSTAGTVEALGTGLYVGNLWYTNYSDRAACRTTGMTRFATFWAEDGEVVAPVNVLRFDDTIYDLLGDKLVGLTDTADVVLDSSTYEGRSTASRRIPGALVEEMTFTL